MNAADSARLELAKRAYRATQPSALEVQTGVRRARLALLRPKHRRKWALKGLVLVVLALGSLAYAKPNALRELAAHGPPLLRGSSGKPGASLTRPREPRPVPSPSVAQSRVPPAPARAESSAAAPFVTPQSPAEPAERSRREAKQRRGAAASGVVSRPPAAAASQGAPPGGEQGISDWGRVGQALARGDEDAALSALRKLSDSEDARTRDKADLGRAQLLMAHGSTDQACSLASALVRRRAGGHIERQALMLLEDCAR
jgi:hypothetical protein